MKKEYKLLFTAQDPGGFNSIAPVIKKISNHNNIILLANESCNIAKKNNINFLDCSELPKEKLEKLLNKISPDFIITATSDNLSLEKKIVAWAKKRGIKSISVVDFWSNYKMRFSNPQTNDLAYLPNRICIIDEYMKNQMIGEGFEENQLCITGNPFFDTFKIPKENGSEKYILFVSQPFSEIGYGNFNEIKIFSDYVKNLKQIGGKLPILIALHPRCKRRNKFNPIIKQSNFKISIAKKEISDLIKKAKLVIGINSMVLFQAAMMRKKVISYQPGINNKKDILISNQLGISDAAYSYNQLKKLLIKSLNQPLISDEIEKIRQKYVNNDSTQKVINIINNFL